jgi:D-sedoheptulose 7-phosphate isomerase
MNMEVRMRKNYYKQLNSLFSSIEVSDRKRCPLSLDNMVYPVVKLIDCHHKKGNKIFIIGNGGSAAIANHMAIDFINAVGIPALTFSESSLITCIANDYGYKHVFAKPITLLAKTGDILFAISSSGKSANIIKATDAARKMGCKIITLSGFNHDNPLRSIGDINFYVPSTGYGYVELVHSVICHYITDALAEKKEHNG